ncbi:MAG TPA: YqgE/AlgH family protein [Caldimonas sp.]|jgi:putative transcriptional regulator|nr:YqgE/AlgH family protein [Caldimonas sp.]
MKAFERVLKSLAVLVVLFAGMSSLAGAADLSRAVILVASDRLAGSPFEKTVILATPLPQGGHMGFVVNRPTGVKLESLLPGQESARNVVDQVYAGGPMLDSVVFAVTRKPPADDSKAVPLIPGLVAVMDGETVDQILETSPNDARYFVGLMVWSPGELDEQVGKGAWEVRPASVEAVLPARSTDLWKSLEGTEI